MPTVRDVLSEKGAKVFSIDPSATVLEATQVMNHHGVGCLVVMDSGRVVGIFTERDVLRRVVAEQQPPADTKVADVMTTKVICVGPETDLDDVAGIMKQKRIRHLPVCQDDGHLTGMVSMGDLNAYHATEQEMTIHYLSDYIYGRA
jgi:CBS domain-containing protein